MIIPHWIWMVFIFAWGCCIGSFLNVVIYRLPREKSLVHPGSACPACGRPIRFYDNIPLLSWLLLRARCRYCQSPITIRYFVIELLTGMSFLGLFVLYFYTSIRPGVSPLFPGGWLVYLTHLVLLACLIAVSAIDLELWIIPISICWFVTAVGVLMSGVSAVVLEPDRLVLHQLMPLAGLRCASLGAGAGIGLGISLVLLSAGWIKRSYDSPEQVTEDQQAVSPQQPPMFHRVQMLKEILFLGPVIIGAVIAYISTQRGPLVPVWTWIVSRPVCAGVLGSVWGYFIGCGTVWATRIIGTLAFGKEAMGLGDVHLMGAVGAVIGPTGVVLAFFIAPFYGLAWALFQMLFKKIHQIPYGPFLSLGTLTVMILQNWILSQVGLMNGY